MRKLIVVAGLASLVTLGGRPAVAQEITYGLKGGLSLARFGGEDAGSGGAEQGNRVGASLGIGFDFPFGETFSLQVEAIYAQKGNSYKGTTDEQISQLDYIDVPVLAKISPGGGAVRPFLFAGPMLSVKAACKMRVKSETIDETFNCSDDPQAAPPVKRLDFGVLFGGGVEYGIGRGSLLLDARYGLGLTSLHDSSDPMDVRNRSLSILAGFSMPMGR